MKHQRRPFPAPAGMNRLPAIFARPDPPVPPIRGIDPPRRSRRARRRSLRYRGALAPRLSSLTSVVFAGLPGSYQDPLQDWKTTTPRFSSFSAPSPVVLVRGRPENVLALYSVSSGVLPPQRLCGAATRIVPGGRAVTGATPPALRPRRRRDSLARRLRPWPATRR